ncbi:MAG: TraR/DksA C4-type zinc finger protein [Acidimicrobiales bacterium]|nr:TraR/DksA C4-type zinc finger protein [Acidimicrobiales bacterium]
MVKKKVAPVKKAAPVVKKKVAPVKKAAAVKNAVPDSSTTAATAARGKAAPAPAAKAAPPKAPPKPTRGAYASEPKFLEEQRKFLLEEREVYQNQAADLRAEAESLALEREPGDVQFDEESGEGGTVAVDRERDLTLSAQALATIEEIDMALLAIEAKTYGACESCGQPIPKARLRALPYARLCVSCKSGGLHRR